MATMLHPIRAFRDSLQHIGAAINASREYSRAGNRGSDGAHSASQGIPL
ncbi:hypothetical protein [Neorhizobium lilium]|nr:hypothetical protein [Neorhizobium lilium]